MAARSKAMNNASGEMNEVEKGLLRMRDEEGASWPKICEFWNKETKAQLKVDSIKKRYSRLKEKHQAWDKEDEERLLASKKKVEENWESVKWAKISEEFVASGGSKKTVQGLKKKVNELARAGEGPSSFASIPSTPKRPATPMEGASRKICKTTAKGKGKASGKTPVKIKDEEDDAEIKDEATPEDTKEEEEEEEEEEAEEEMKDEGTLMKEAEEGEEIRCHSSDWEL